MEKKDEFKKVAITYEMFDEKGVKKLELDDDELDQVTGGTLKFCIKDNRQIDLICNAKITCDMTDFGLSLQIEYK